MSAHLVFRQEWIVIRRLACLHGIDDTGAGMLGKVENAEM